MRPLTVLLVALAVAGCGSAADETAAPASSGETSAPAATTTRSSDSPGQDDVGPPRILLVSPYGNQTAVRGSYCVGSVVEKTGMPYSMCADAPRAYPAAVTSVARGDRVAVVVEDAVFGPDSVVTIRPLGCTDEAVDRIALAPGTAEHRWNVDLEPGAYQLDVFARFERGSGSGDVSGAVGLTVAGPKEWDALGAALQIRPGMQVCRFEH